MSFQPIVPPLAQRPLSNFSNTPYALVNMVRDNFNLTTWLLFGALAQSFLVLGVGLRIAALPVVGILAYRVLDAYLQTIGLKHNKAMDGVILKKFSSQIPDELGDFGRVPANDKICVFLIGTRTNHPMGMLAPGAKELGGYFGQMAKDLEAHADEFGFLGMSSWIGTGARATNNELMQVGYFSSVEGLTAFAHSDYHRKGWDWWNQTVKQHPHLSIMHETYSVPKGNWEGIWSNSHLTGLSATTFKVTDRETGGPVYMKGAVDASKGILRTSAGRMNRAKGDENDKYDT